jgi:hypothetical protein
MEEKKIVSWFDSGHQKCFLITFKIKIERKIVLANYLDTFLSLIFFTMVK